MKILLADDEDSIRLGVQHLILKNGFEFCYAANGLQAIEVFKKEQPDLAILDIMMPEMNGFDACTAIRAISNVPIIILSAKGDIVDKTIGFKCGADDYLVKPFSALELELRINALLRRSLVNQDNQQKTTEVSNKNIVLDDLEVLFDQRQVKVCGKVVELTPKEFEIIAFMASHLGQSFSREQLLSSIWGYDYVGDSNIVTVFIRKIREKIELDPAKPKYLLTVWGYGYKFGNK